ncbi:MAG: hypothetical protein JO345_33460 [Streptosporangiaceae bacterium]|nr:hypothetical protein [Streptosporangiaceae bacterium]
MSAANLLDFLGVLANRRDILEELNTKAKDEVIEAAAKLGYEFSAAEYDGLIWPLEIELAKKRGEEFNEHFPLWHLMWGRYYLEFVAEDLLGSFTPAELDQLRTADRGSADQGSAAQGRPG